MAELREINAAAVTEAVALLCQQANYELGDDVLAALKKARETEESPQGKQALDQIIANARVAKEDCKPLCQDCGAAVVFLEVGQDAHIVGGDLNKAVEEGVRHGYTKGYLRKSMVKPPFTKRANTKDNTPPIIHSEVVPGNRLKIVLLPKGAGAENMSKLYMLNPSDGRDGIIEAVVKAVDQAGGNPCPPLVLGLGIGGTSDMAMLMAKKALLRPVGQPSPDPDTARLEKDILERVNDLGIGPMGYGGRVTALAVHIESMPVHMGSLPVGINFQCHSSRHKEIAL